MSLQKLVAGLSAVFLCLCGGYPLHAETPAPSAADLEFFEKDVRPLLVNQCFQCHSTDKKQKGGLLLDSREGILTGGDNGPALVPGKADDSRLIRAVRYNDPDLRMPPKGKLKDDEIAVLTKWVAAGAPWPAASKPMAKAAKGEFNFAERARYWSFQPIKAGTPPAVKQGDWPLVDSDRFILAELEAKGLKPAPAADKRTWLRRVTFDLIGLPPTAAEIDAFLADESPKSYETVVNRLLDSPHYGERWGRHWLDLVRFAETQGHEFDYEIPNAWRYRDYVTRTLNLDLPYNQFVIEHIAGDLLPEPRRHPAEKFNESIIGTGFWWLGEGKHSPVDVRAEEAARVDNQIDVLCKTFLGMTVSCARCHDHKFDPIPTKDYYALFGFLQSSRMQQAFIDDPEPWRQRLETLREKERLAAEAGRKAVAAARIAQLNEMWPRLIAITPQTTEQPGLTAQQLETYRTELKVAREQVTHPLHTLATLAETPADQFEKAREDLTRRLVDQAERSKQPVQDARDLADFNQPDFGDWFVTGHAFGEHPLRGDDVVRLQVLKRAETAGLQPGIAHSGSWSPKLRGVLRSPTFTLDRNHIWMRVAGKDTKIRLVMDEFHLIQNPIYGGLAFAPPHADKFAWVEMNVTMWQGHRAYLEFIDDSDGFVAIDRITMTNGGPPPDAPSQVALGMAQDPNVKTLADVHSRLTQWLKEIASATDQSQVLSNPVLAELCEWLYRDNLLGAVQSCIVSQPAEGQAEYAQRMRAFLDVESAIPVPTRALAMTDGTPENERVFIRGNHKTQGDEVPRRLLEVLGANQPAIEHGSGRLELAKRMVDPANPLTARVIVNRVWQHHFGEGIVRSPDDFGHMGQLPSHPELLDYLAAEFIKDGWSLKRLHRRLLLSQTYRMSSQGDKAADEADPQNRMWHKMPIQRLEAELVRDAILAASGRLRGDLFGPGVLPYLTPYMNGRGRPASGPLDGDGRRSLYINVRRNFLTPMLQAFDYPIPFTTVGKRTVSNVPAQALCLMNNQFVEQQAEVWSKRIVDQAKQDPAACINNMYVTAFARPATEQELAEGREFIATQSKLYPPDQPHKAWADLAHVLFNYKEFIFIK